MEVNNGQPCAIAVQSQRLRLASQHVLPCTDTHSLLCVLVCEASRRCNKQDADRLELVHAADPAPAYHRGPTGPLLV